MRYLFIILFVISNTFFVNAQSRLEEEFNITINEDPSFFVCGTYYSSLKHKRPFDDFENKMLKYFGMNPNHPQKRQIIGIFLNEYHNILICDQGSTDRLRDKEPLIKRAIGQGEYGFINHLMYYEEDYQYNLNHYELVDGKKETILDYIEKILNSPELLKRYEADALKVLYNDFIEFDAKRGSEL